MAKEKELENLKKLSPEQRIARLKKLQKKDKAEIQEAQKLITESEEQIAKEEQLKEIPIPQIKAVDIDQLFSAEEKQMFKAKRFVSRRPEKIIEEKFETAEMPLEQAVEQLRPAWENDMEAEEHRQYQIRLSQRPAAELRGHFDSVYQGINHDQGPNEYQRQQLYNIARAESEKLHAMRAGEYVPSEEAMDEIARVREAFKMMYKRGW